MEKLKDGRIEDLKDISNGGSSENMGSSRNIINKLGLSWATLRFSVGP